MEMQGDIHVWIDSEMARAQLTLVGPEGQVTISAEAPLAAARRYLHRILAARGENVSGVGEERLGELTDQIGRSRALRLLRKVAPAAFIPGGLLTLAIARRLRRRRRRPVAPLRGKRIGPAPPEALPPEPEYEPAEEQEYEEPEYEPSQDDDDPSDETSGVDEVASYDDTSGDDHTALGASSAIPAAALAASPQLQAGAALLSAAKTSPKAARKIRGIFRRAKAGHPQAQKSARVLVAADKAQKEQSAAMKALVRNGTEPPASAASAMPSRLPPAPPRLPPLPLEATLAAPQRLLPPPQDRSFSPFRTWRRGIV
jgi:hypothetical protein